MNILRAVCSETVSGDSDQYGQGCGNGNSDLVTWLLRVSSSKIKMLLFRVSITNHSSVFTPTHRFIKVFLPLADISHWPACKKWIVHRLNSKNGGSRDFCSLFKIKGREQFLLYLMTY